jgi:2-haloacid dehalogenase/putative hydrolase of the HAD superfamily
MTREDFDMITFDCYGTLIDWESGIVNAFQDTFGTRCPDRHHIIEAYMLEEPQVESGQYQSYREVLADTATRVCQRLNIDTLSSTPDFLSRSIAEWLPFPDTQPALSRLAKRYLLGILSNVDDELLAATLRRFGVAFEMIVTAQQVRSYKPEHAHFLEARRRLDGARQLHAAQSYFHDVIPARTLGIKVAWVNRKSEFLPKGSARPDYEVRNLAELADLLGV